MLDPITVASCWAGTINSIQAVNEIVDGFI